MNRLRRPLLAAALALLASVLAAAATHARPTDPPAKDAPPAGRNTLPPPSKAERDRTSILSRAPKPGIAGFIGDPYPLDTCIVDGKPLGEKPVVVVLTGLRDVYQEGRQMKFCCEACAEKFKAESARYLSELDHAIAARYANDYPLDHCLVMLEEKIGPDAQVFVLGNRVYKSCCKKCVNNFQKSWERYSQAYEKAVIIKQKGKYPLDTCVVSGAKLPEKPYDLVFQSHLVRLADEAAAKKFLADPLPYVAKLQEAIKNAKGTGKEKDKAKH